MKIQPKNTYIMPSSIPTVIDLSSSNRSAIQDLQKSELLKSWQPKGLNLYTGRQRLLLIKAD